MLRPWQFEIQLDKNCDKPLYLQIADAIIQAVKSGKLSSGNALPGSRQLAGLFQVNRNTVIEALDVLIAEGWLITIDRKGTLWRMFRRKCLLIRKTNRRQTLFQKK